MSPLFLWITLFLYLQGNVLGSATPTFGAVYWYSNTTTNCSQGTLPDRFLLGSVQMLNASLGLDMNSLCALGTGCTNVSQLTPQGPVRIQCFSNLSSFQPGWDYRHETLATLVSFNRTTSNITDLFAGSLMIDAVPMGKCLFGTKVVLNTTSRNLTFDHHFGCDTSCSTCAGHTTHSLAQTRGCPTCQNTFIDSMVYVNTTQKSFYSLSLSASDPNTTTVASHGTRDHLRLPIAILAVAAGAAAIFSQIL